MLDPPASGSTGGSAPFFSIVVPSRGEDRRLSRLLPALAAQTYPAVRRELLIVLDGAPGTPALEAAVRAQGGEVLRLAERAGPGAARNAGARRARGAYLVFTEDDVAPAPDWLERAAARLAADLAPEVLVGATEKPGGRPVRVGRREHPHYLPTNLFVRRDLFERLGGYCEAFFDARSGAFFREDSDFGFTLEESGARIAHADDVRVAHPEEHPGFWDPVRWARRYEMDALLEARHPRLFRERIEVHAIGPFALRRPIVRACLIHLIALAGGVVAWIAGDGQVGGALLLLALLALIPVWAKWRLHPLRLPAVLLVPPVLLFSYLRGTGRARRVRRARA